MKLNPTDIKKTSKEMLEKLQDGDLRSRIATVWSQQAEIIIAAVAALIVGILLLLIQ